MRNLLLTLMFDGKNYHGWQVQQNAVTVQQTVQDAIEKITGVREGLTGCSRTDSGVHANMFCCNMRTESPIGEEKLKTALNAVLPRDIAVTDCRKVPLNFHARYDCVSKEYKYLILTSRQRNPFYENRALFYPYEINASLLDAQARDFLGTHDFSAFCASGSSAEDKTRTIKSIGVREIGQTVEITVEADGFLYNMVRIIVGTLLCINSGKIEKGSIPRITASGERKNAGDTAPACGLYLNRVNYHF